MYEWWWPLRVRRWIPLGISRPMPFELFAFHLLRLLACLMVLNSLATRSWGFLLVGHFKEGFNLTQEGWCYQYLMRSPLIIRLLHVPTCELLGALSWVVLGGWGIFFYFFNFFLKGLVEELYFEVFFNFLFSKKSLLCEGFSCQWSCGPYGKCDDCLFNLVYRFEPEVVELAKVRSLEW